MLYICSLHIQYMHHHRCLQSLMVNISMIHYMYVTTVRADHHTSSHCAVGFKHVINLDLCLSAICSYYVFDFI